MKTHINLSDGFAQNERIGAAGFFPVVRLHTALHFSACIFICRRFLFSFLTILFCCSFFSKTEAQPLFQSGFETGEPTFIYNSTTNTAATISSLARTGTAGGGFSSNGTFDGSIITGSQISFNPGVTYYIQVWARAITCTSKLRIMKSITPSNAAMLAASGADIILNSGSNNVTSGSYTQFTATFTVSAPETKYVGFQLQGTGGGACGSINIRIDDIFIDSYCMVSGNTAGTYISEVSFNSISRTSGFDGYIYTGYSTPVQKTISYDLSVSIYNPGANNLYTAAWIDWNNNGSFADAGENVMTPALTSTSIGTTIRIVSVNVPSSASLGTVRMRVVNKFNANLTDACDAYSVYIDWEDYDVEIFPPPVPMVYSSSNAFHSNLNSVNAGTFNQEALGLEIITTGTISPVNVTSFTFNTTGTTNPSTDVSGAKLWTTGTNPNFATSTALGTAVSNPNGTFSFTATYTLETGSNFFWVTYDIPAPAPGGNVIDATCNSITVGGSNYSPSPSAPAGNRTIVAATPMIYVSSTTVQNISPAPRPDANQWVISMHVVTDGALSPLTATTFNFNTTGTTSAANDIQNAKLWFSGYNNSFSSATQVGTVIAAPNGAFSIIAGSILYSGYNYFWLSYDVKPTSGCNPNAIDAQCVSIVVGGVTRTPTVTSPLGNRPIDCRLPYYSQGNLPVDQLISWNSERNGTGSIPLSFASGSTFYVQMGHEMTTNTAVTIPYMTIENGGKITSTFLISMTDLRITGGGIFEQRFKALNGTYISNFFIENNGTWIHNNSGYLPNLNRYFSPRSNQWFYQWGGGTFPVGTAWGNVLLNGSTPGNFGMGNVLNNVQGDLEFRRIGNNNYLRDEMDETINIGGDLIFSGGSWKVAWGRNNSGICNQNRTVTVNVTGNFIMSAGLLQDFDCGGNNSKCILNIGGNVDISGGTLSFNGSPNGLSEINLTGGTASVTWSQTGGTVTLCNTNIKNGKTVSLAGSTMGNVAASRTINVESGAALYCSTFAVSGAGTFNLQSGATLGIGSANGINSGGASGNIQTTTRTFNSGATYEYYSGVNPQSSGVFTVTPTAGTVANLRINKTNSTDQVTLNQALRVSTNLNLMKGIFNTTTTFLLTINNGATSNQGSLNSYVDGPMKKIGNSAFIFPVGNSGRWARLEISAPSSSTAEFQCRYFAAPYSNTTAMAAVPATVLNNVSLREYWTLDRVVSTNNVTVKLYWEIASWSGITNCIDLVVARWNGSAWENANGTSTATTTGTCSGTGTGTVLSNTVSTFSPFTFGSKSSAVNPLPVELLHFSAKPIQGKVELNWATASERNNCMFNVERSTDGRSFHFINSLDGHYSTDNITHYKTYDLFPLYGISYYRLKQIDCDGMFQYSNVAYVNFLPVDLTIYPTLIRNNENAFIEFSETGENDLQIFIYSQEGKLVKIQNEITRKGMNRIEIELSELSRGVYVIKFSKRNNGAGRIVKL